MCTTCLDIERRGGMNFLHGLIPSRCHVHKEHLLRHESKLACCGAPSSRLLQHIMGNMYKKSYALICDEFIAHVHFIIFKKECPRLSTKAKKRIAKVGHWYFDEHSTYIRVFGATRAPHLLIAHIPDHLARL